MHRMLTVTLNVVCYNYELKVIILTMMKMGGGMWSPR